MCAGQYGNGLACPVNFYCPAGTVPTPSPLLPKNHCGVIDIIFRLLPLYFRRCRTRRGLRWPVQPIPARARAQRTPTTARYPPIPSRAGPRPSSLHSPRLSLTQSRSHSLSYSPAHCSAPPLHPPCIQPILALSRTPSPTIAAPHRAWHGSRAACAGCRGILRRARFGGEQVPGQLLLPGWVRAPCPMPRRHRLPRSGNLLPRPDPFSRKSLSIHPPTRRRRDPPW